MYFLSYNNTFFHKILSKYYQTCIESLGWALGVKECLQLNIGSKCISSSDAFKIWSNKFFNY
jgi:hypothetical protein